jgi:ribosomal protein S15P/S13E
MNERKKPVWLKLSEEELKKITEELKAKGCTNEKIGLILRDQYGIPTTAIYEKKLALVTGLRKDDLKNLQKRLEEVRKHYQKNKQDKIAKWKIIEVTSKINKLESYYSKKKRE